MTTTENKNNEEEHIRSMTDEEIDQLWDKVFNSANKKHTESEVIKN